MPIRFFFAFHSCLDIPRAQALPAGEKNHTWKTSPDGFGIRMVDVNQQGKSHDSHRHPDDQMTRPCAPWGRPVAKADFI